MKYNIIEYNLIMAKMVTNFIMFLESRKNVGFGEVFGDGAPDGDFFGGGGALPTSGDRTRSAVSKMGEDGPRYLMISSCII